MHSENGSLLKGGIYYNAEFTFVRLSGKNIDTDKAKKLDNEIDSVLSKIKAHFDSKIIYKALALLNEAYTQTDKNVAFSRCWMALEHLMLFTENETHSHMLGRMRFMLPNEIREIWKGVLETLRTTRNSLSHSGEYIDASTFGPFSNPTHVLFNIVQSLISFHLNLPVTINSSDDFKQFTDQPVDERALLKKKELATEMLKLHLRNS